VPSFGRTSLRLIYISITKHTYILRSTVTEMMARDFYPVLHNVPVEDDLLCVHCTDQS
jgi:hypothetical protein